MTPASLPPSACMGSGPDAAAAAEWYRRGAASGDAEAASLLQGLPSRGRHDEG